MVVTCASAALAGQTPDTPEALLRELADPARRAAAASRLFEQKARGASALAGVIADLPDDAWQVAQRVLIELGPAAVSALPSLADLAREPRHRRGLMEVISHLALFTPEAQVPNLYEADSFSAHVGFDSHAPITHLVDQLMSVEWAPRQCVIEVLAARAVELREELRSNPELRDLLLDTLVDLAGPSIAVGSRDRVQPWAALALARLAPDDPRSVPGHLAELEHPSRQRRMRALHALAELGDANPTVLRAMQQALADPDPRVVIEAVTAIGTLNTRAHGLAGHLQPLAASDNPTLAAIANAVLTRLSAAGVDPELACSFYENGTQASQGHIRGATRTGSWHFWHVNGNDQSAGEYVAGKPHGEWTFWYENGSVSAQGNYDKGLETGAWTFRYDDGPVAKAGRYENGKPIGKWTFHDRNGRVKTTVRY